MIKRFLASFMTLAGVGMAIGLFIILLNVVFYACTIGGVVFVTDFLFGTDIVGWLQHILK